MVNDEEGKEGEGQGERETDQYKQSEVVLFAQVFTRQSKACFLV